MPIENPEEIDDEKEPSSIYDRSIRILGEGGIDPEEAYKIIDKLHEEFHGRVKANIIEQAAERALDESKNLKSDDILRVFREEVIRARRKINRSLRSGPDKEERIIYRGPGGEEIKESSNN
jgi:hypothetical protein